MKKILCVCVILLCIVGCSGSDSNPTANDDRKVVLVTGATGTQGGAVARELLQRGYPVRGLTRNPNSEKAMALADLGATMVKGDFNDSDSLATAMQDTHGVFAVTDFWEHGYNGEVEHGKNLIDAAKAAGVDHFVFTSVAGADIYTGIPHFESKGEIEEYLAASGIDYSVVRPVSFMDNVRYLRGQLMSGVFFDPRDPGKIHHWIAASDIGFFVGEAFDKPGEWKGQSLDIAGDAMTLAEYVDVLSYGLGIDIHHQQTSWSAFEKEAGEEMTVMHRWFDAKGYDVDVDALRDKYPNLLTYAQFLQSVNWQ